MNRSIRTLLLVAVVAALSLVAPAAPAGAIDPWPAVSCATGEMSADLTATRPALTGWIQPCAGATIPQQARFGVVYYWPHAGFLMHPRGYGDPAAPTAFSGLVGFLELGPQAPVAVCLQASATMRLSCVAITVGDGGPDDVSLPPLDIHAPAVTVPISPVVGTCGTCV